MITSLEHQTYFQEFVGGPVTISACEPSALSSGFGTLCGSQYLQCRAFLQDQPQECSHWRARWEQVLPQGGVFFPHGHTFQEDRDTSVLLSINTSVSSICGTKPSHFPFWTSFYRTQALGMLVRFALLPVKFW